MKFIMLSRVCFFFLTLFGQIHVSYGQTVKIVIDAGHGGSDPGNVSSNPKDKQEKEINLLIAKKLGDYLSTKLSHVEVIYTRTDDSYPSLDARVEKANTSKADLFISIHCNHSSNSKIKGTETHVDNMMARKSVKFAKEIEKEFKNRAGRTSRGVKNSNDREKSLQVLKMTQMTSVLVECGFMSNPSEVAYLQSGSGQDVLASAIFRATRSYLQSEFPKLTIAKADKKKDGEESVGSQESTKNQQYTVQIMSSRVWMDTEKGEFKKLDEAVIRKQVSTTGYKYVYYSGDFESKEAAQEYCEKVKSKGFKDAIITKKTS
jgi:N-acetylmuramoyl-L-alanine amidase